MDDASIQNVLEGLAYQGYAFIESAVPAELLARTRTALYSAQKAIEREIGTERLARAGELGVVRIPFRFDETFFEYLTLAPVLEVVNATVGETAILHLMNGFILPSVEPAARKVFQQTFHRDFPRDLNGYVASINVFVAVDAFTPENGATLVVPGTHQRVRTPDEQYMRTHALPMCAPAGSLLLFDSTVWHAAGINHSGADRLALNMQFTKSFIKQQIDYVRALGSEKILTLPERSQQLLGWYTRVVTSLDEYYRPEGERLYRKGQG